MICMRYVRGDACDACDACLYAKNDWFVWIGPPFQRQCVFWKPVFVVLVFVRVPARWTLAFLVIVNVGWTIGWWKGSDFPTLGS